MYLVNSITFAGFLLVAIPSRSIGALLQPIYEMIISNRIENKKLAATRDTLLPKLMNGEIDMSEVDYE